MNAAAAQRLHGYRQPTRDRRHSGLKAPALARVAGAALVIAAAVVVVLALTLTPAQPRPVSWSAISVDQTGTLWEIAAEHGVDGLSTAETVQMIREENGLASSTLYVGQTLVVPAASNDTLAVAQR